MDLKAYFESKSKLIDATLDEILPAESTYPQTIHQAMRYSVFSGGKRFRPILTLATAEMLGEKLEKKDVLISACAVELVHNYSLIHDDLPSLDNDDYRRGRLTCHRQFNESTAILAGIALLNLAFQVLSEQAKKKKKLEEKMIYFSVIKELATASGVSGMVGGQAVDIQSENKPVSKKRVMYIHSHKTGALIKAAVRIGAFIGKANRDELTALTNYAENLGLAFQITDDILNVIGDRTHAYPDRRQGTDKKRGKATYPAVFGLSESYNQVDKLIKRSIKALSIFGDRGNILVAIAEYIGNRCRLDR